MIRFLKSTLNTWFLFALCLSTLAALGIPALTPALADEPLAPQDAFVLSARYNTNDTLAIQFGIVDGYYLYRDKVHVSIIKPSAGVLGEAVFSNSEAYEDEFFGRIDIHRQSLNITIPYTAPIETASSNALNNSPNTVLLKIESQGCADMGICYPPHEQKIHITQNDQWVKWKSNDTAFQNNNIFNSVKDIFSASSATPTNTLNNSLTSPPLDNSLGAPTTSPPLDTSSNKPLNEFSGLADDITNQSFIWSLLIFFGFGILLSLTPCNLPMVPILGTLITGSFKKKNHHSIHVQHDTLHPHIDTSTPSLISSWRGLFLAAAFVLGMSMTYSFIGVLAGLTGNLLSTQLQIPSVQIGAAIMILILAGASFEWYSIRLPSALQSWLRDHADEQQQGSILGLIISGAISALIIGPCVAVPLMGLLVYISHDGSPSVGAALLFTLAWGQGLPLLVFGFFAGRFIPKLGAWMKTINALFGFLLIGLAIWMITPLLSLFWQFIVWGSWYTLCAIFLRALDSLPHQVHAVHRVGKAIGIVFFVIGISLWFGALSGSDNLWQPFQFKSTSNQGTSMAPIKPSWKTVTSPDQLDQALQNAALKNGPILVDYYATWCVTCEEIERMLSEPQVAQALSRFSLIRADVSENSNENHALLKRFDLFGPPAMLFFLNGQELFEERLIGTESTEAFLLRLSRIK